MIKKFYALFLVLLVSTPAYATDCRDPKTFIQSKSEEILPVLQQTSLSKEQKHAQFISIFDQIIDYDWMAGFILGHNSDKLTAAQKDEFRKAYREYIIASYVGKLNDYTGNEKVIVKDASAIDKQNSYVVNITVVNSPGDEDDFSVMLRKSESCYKIGDVMAEGVSILKTQKQDFTSILLGNGYDSLIKTLKEKSLQ